MRMLRLLPALLLVCTALAARAEIAIQEVTSPGGITAWLVEDHGIPFTAMEIAFEGGTSLDLPGSRGAVNLMAATLEEGAGELDSQGFAAARDALAAEFGFSAGRDSVSISARFLTENRDQALELLRQAIIEPRFDEDGGGAGEGPDPRGPRRGRDRSAIHRGRGSSTRSPSAATPMARAATARAKAWPS